VEIAADGYVSVKVVNPEWSVYKVQNCLNAIRIFAESSLRTAIGKLDLQEILDNRQLINTKVINDLKEEIVEWGFMINRCELNSVEARDNRVKTALNDQINAEQTSKQKQIQADS